MKEGTNLLIFGGWCAFISYMLFLVVKTITGGLVFYQNGTWTTQRIDRYQLLFKPMFMSETHNFVPFKTMYQYLIHHQMYNSEIWFTNTFGNVLLFIPFGFLLPVVFRRCQTIGIVIGVSALLAAMIELVQLLTKTGIGDVDAIILRTIGSIVGISIFSSVVWAINQVKNRAKLVRN